MNTNWKDYLLPILIGLCALSVSASAAIYSVSGLAKLFAGASIQVMIMAGSLEVAKLVIATLLHQYWNTLNKVLRLYLTISVAVLVLITSMGIYGFLSSAYQNTAIGFETASKEVVFLKQKEAFYQKDLDRLDEELNRISSAITGLSQTRATEIKDASGSTTGVSTTELRLADSRIRSEEANRTQVLANRNVVADSLKNIQTKILNLEVQASSNAELGPLIYLSKLTGESMDVIINALLLVIIFVFDPLAISLVLAANFAFDKIKNKSIPEPVKQPKAEPIEVKDKKLRKVKNKPKPGRKGRPSSKKPKKIGFEVEETPPPPFEPEVQQELPEPVQEPVKADEGVVEPEEIKEPEVEIEKIIIHQKEESEEASEKVFDEGYTGNIPVDAKIGKILQKTPSHVSVLLTNGKRLRLTRKEYEDFINRQNLNKLQ